ncbi:MAG: hypothetical protein M0Q98_13405 [Pseudomonas sp.]|jgi:hypothetical protein|nr:hypothetical protein [Pseudomonas sp.]
MTTFTNEELLDAIREAYSLEELQRMVGPSEEESQRNRLRDKTLGKYYKQFGNDHNKWPEYAKDLLTEQGQFEAKYL